MSKKKECAPCARKTSIGGQALIEGIMMRGSKKTAMAVRNPDGEIVLEQWNTEVPKTVWVKIPVVRGVVNFVLTMIAGYKALGRSAEIAGLEELEEESKKKKQKKAKKAEPTADGDASAEQSPETAEVEEKAEKEKKSSDSSPLMMVLMIVAGVLGVALAILLFVALPTFLYDGLVKLLFLLVDELKNDALESLVKSVFDNIAIESLVQSVFEGILRIAILVVYMLAVSLMKDIRKTFQYHGAEHKTIFCYEHGRELTVENVRRERRFHPRCGTSFLILMLLVSIGIGCLIPPAEAIGIESTWVYTLIRAALKLILIPLTMGIGYELLKLAGKYDNVFTRIISAPGMWMQRITVYEPTEDMIECAIKAFVAVLPEEEKAKALTEETPVAEEKTDAE